MTDMNRRAAIRSTFALSAAALIPAWALTACKKDLHCDDVAGLSDADKLTRTNAKYVDETPDLAKQCSGCQQFVPPPGDACGGCKVVKGPINPKGYCTLWSKKA